MKGEDEADGQVVDFPMTDHRTQRSSSLEVAKYVAWAIICGLLLLVSAGAGWVGSWASMKAAEPSPCRDEIAQEGWPCDKRADLELLGEAIVCKCRKE